jgi:hypothetical protein
MMDFLQINPEQIYLSNHICHFFQYMIFKFGILKEDYLRTNSIDRFFDPLLRSPGIGLELGIPLKINFFHNFSKH